MIQLHRSHDIRPLTSLRSWNIQSGVLQLALIAALALAHTATAQTAVNPATQNPLIVEELSPLTNPSFEENLKDWGANADDDFQTIGNFVSAPQGYQSEKSIATAKSGYLPRSFQLIKGERYYVTAKIKTVGSATGDIRVVYGASGEPSSASVPPDTDWKQVGVSFTGTEKGQPKDAPDVALVEIRLGAAILDESDGKAKVYLDDIHVYRIRDYAPHFRFQVLEGIENSWRLQLYGNVGPPNWYLSKNYFWEEGVKVGEWSPWESLREELPGRDTASIGFQFQDMKGAKPDHLKVRVQFAYAPDEKAVVETQEAAFPGNILGYILPKTEATPDDFLEEFQPLAASIKERNQKTHALFSTPAKLQKYYFEAHLKGFDQFFSDPTLVDMEVDTIRTIGFSALDTQYSGLAGAYRIAAEKQGIAQTHHTMRSFNLPLNPDQTALLDWQKIENNINEAVDKWVAELIRQDEKQVALIKLVDIGDEIDGFVFNGPEYEAEYRKYLEEQHVPPQPLGFASAEQIKPFGVWNWRESRQKKPETTNIEACRSYYWTLRFWNWTNARVYGLMTAALEKKLPGITTRVNFGPPWAYEYGSYLRGSEMWEFARQKGVSAFWNEDWLNTFGWRHSGIQLMAYETDINRSLANLQSTLWTNKPEWNMMVMPEGEQNIQLKLASTIGKGSKKVDIYRYGPKYASPDEWSSSLPMAKGVGDFVRELQKVESSFHPGQPRPARVAIVWSASNDIWRDSNAPAYDRQLIYLALLHRQIPVDFIDEFEVAQGGLKKYDVAFLPSQYLRRDAMQAITKWVQAGGNLWADGLAGSGDEYGQPSELLLPTLGIKDLKITKTEKTDFDPQHGIPVQEPLGTIKFKDNANEVSAMGWRVDFGLSDPSRTKILATFEDDKPAIIEHSFGKGRVRYVGTLAGLGYSRPVARMSGKIETGYREQERRLITDLPLQAGVKRPVISSVPTVEADLLESAQGIGIMLANYSGEKQNALTLTISVPRKVTSATSARIGKLPLAYDDKTKTAKLTLPLELVDFIAIK